jgi:predicted Rossmann fold flavoprotein
MSEKREILVVGGGASGLMTALTAARLGARVRVLERMSRVGKKLLATGNGRCNLTNMNMDVRFFHGAKPRFVQSVLDRFDLTATLAFFEELGIVPRVEEEGKVFPESEQASSVLDLLRYELGRLGVEEICDCSGRAVQRDSSGLVCRATDGREFRADRIIVAAGGKSAPNMGSNGGGQKIAESMGHRVIETFPALVQVNLDSPFLKRLQGLKLRGDAVVLVDGCERRTERGELLFTDYGISGPPILQLSRVVSEFTARGRDVRLRLDLFPDVSEERLRESIRARIERAPHRNGEYFLVGFLHKRLAPLVLKEAGVERMDQTCGEWTAETPARLAALLKRWEWRCSGVQSWMNSQVTAGGVDTAELDPETLESRLVPGVHFAGEVLDVDGDCGGYNLQWAWSSGFVAATGACRV